KTRGRGGRRPPGAARRRPNAGPRPTPPQSSTGLAGAGLLRRAAPRNDNRFLLSLRAKRSNLVSQGDREKAFEKGFVDRRQLGDVGNLDPLVGLVHRLPDKTEFGNRAMGVDKPRVGGAAGRAELGGQPGDRADRGAEAVADRARRHKKRFAADF